MTDKDKNEEKVRIERFGWADEEVVWEIEGRSGRRQQPTKPPKEPQPPTQ
jgi:hypothetical protein